MVIEPCMYSLSHGIPTLCIILYDFVSSGPTVSKILVEVIIIMHFTFPIVVEDILNEFRDQFISDMDVNMIVMDLLHKEIISDSVRERTERADGPTHRSEILHEYLKRTCTEEAFRTVCDITGSVRGNPRMSALGKDMQRSLESGVCVCMSICMHFIH